MIYFKTFWLHWSNILQRDCSVFIIFYDFEDQAQRKNSELQQLCEDILVYRRDMIEMRQIEKESRKKREQEDKRKGEEMRQAAVERLAS